MFNMYLHLSEVSRYRLDVRGIVVRFPEKKFVLRNVQTVSGAQQTSYSMSNVGSFPEEKRRPKSEADHPPATSINAKNVWSYTSITSYALMAWKRIILTLPFWSNVISGSRNCPIFTGQESYDSWPVKMGPIPCPETSVNNYHPTPRNIPEERRSHLVVFFQNDTRQRTA